MHHYGLLLALVLRLLGVGLPELAVAGMHLDGRRLLNVGDHPSIHHPFGWGRQAEAKNKKKIGNGDLHELGLAASAAR